MVNKTNLGIGAVIALLTAAYLGVDFDQNNTDSTQNIQHPTISESKSNPEVVQKSIQGQDSDQQKYAQALDKNKTDKNNSQHNISSQNSHGLEVIRQSFDRKISNVQVQSQGRVKVILRDDNEGSRHQKFILSLDNGLTILVAHNIDLSPRIENLKKGDIVEFFGEYEYSPQGGVIHWTHHDPRGRHTDGWLKHQGKSYG